MQGRLCVLHTGGVRFGVTFLVVAVLLLVGAWATWTWPVGDTLAGQAAIVLMLWTALACCLVSTAWLLPIDRATTYHRVRWIYGKRDDGKRAWWSTIAILPFFGPVFCWWHARRPGLREAPWHELEPDLVIGRRLLDREFDLEVAHVVDLTCEYSERPQQRGHPGYLSLPIVDGAAPPPAVLLAYARRIAELRGRIFLHCAEGHGRTATVAAAVLLVRGRFGDVDAALAHIASVRPEARPYARQQRVLRRMAALLEG